MTFRLYVDSPLSDCQSLCWGRTAPEVTEEEGSYALRFYHWFLESFKSFLLFLVAVPGLIDTLSSWLEGLCYECLWCGDEDTWHRVISSARHRWPDLWRDIYFLFQSGDVSTVEGNTHTRARARALTRKQQFSKHLNQCKKADGTAMIVAN